MNIDTGITIVDYYVVFDKSDLDHWIMKWLDPYFQHCYAVRLSDGGRFWIVINPKRGFTRVTLQAVEKYPTIRALVGRGPVVMNVRSILTDERRFRLCVMNCVEVVKNLLGLDRPLIFTPFQLYKHLSKGGK